MQREPVAQNKLHHYVPRCYMRPFTSDGDRKAINLYNVASQRLVRNAPIQGQCSRNYFYGKSGTIDEVMQTFETQYGPLLQKITEDAQSATPADLSFLAMFTLLQHNRTAAAMRRQAFFNSAMKDAIRSVANPDPKELDMSPLENMYMVIKMTFETHYVVEDLTGCFLINRTPHDFIISDNPSIFTNKYGFQRSPTGSFGLGSAGAMWFLPMSPRICFFMYDRDVYSMPPRDGHILAIDKSRDVYRVNQFQYLNFLENVYFKSWSDRNRIIEEINNASAHRPSEPARVNIGVRVSEDERGATYRMVPIEDINDEDEIGNRIINLQPVFPRPPIWPIFIQYKSRPRFYSDGSAIGHQRYHVRRHELLNPLPEASVQLNTTKPD